MALDASYGGPEFDLLTDVGFTNALFFAANLQPGASCVAAPVCSTFLFMTFELFPKSFLICVMDSFPVCLRGSSGTALVHCKVIRINVAHSQQPLWKNLIAGSPKRDDLSVSLLHTPPHCLCKEMLVGDGGDGTAQHELYGGIAMLPTLVQDRLCSKTHDVNGRLWRTHREKDSFVFQ